MNFPSLILIACCIICLRFEADAQLIKKPTSLTDAISSQFETISKTVGNLGNATLGQYNGLLATIANSSRNLIGLGMTSVLIGLSGGATEKPSFTIPALNKECQECFAYVNRCPPLKDNATNYINFTFIVDSFGEIDDLAETLTTSGKLVMTWDIEFRNFNITGFNWYKERVIVPETIDVWRPRILLANSVDDPQMKSEQISDTFEVVYEPLQEYPNFFPPFPTKPYMPVRLRFILMRTGVFKTSCNLDLSQFPFDKQTCSLVFEMKEISSFTQFDAASRLFLPNSTSGNNEIVLINADVRSTLRNSAQMTSILGLDNSNYEVSQLIYTFSFKRRPQYYIFNLVCPCLVLAVLAQAVFFLSNETAERATFSVTILLAFCFLQSDFIKELPKTPQTVLMGTYFFYLTIYTGACTLQSMLMFWLTMVVFKDRCKTIRICKTREITLLRIFDVCCALIALGCLVAVNYICLGNAF